MESEIECCKHLDLVPLMRDYDRGDGVCIHLNNNNLCSIYKSRPNICNGKYIYENDYSHMSVDEFHIMVSQWCEEVRKRVWKKTI